MNSKTVASEGVVPLIDLSAINSQLELEEDFADAQLQSVCSKIKEACEEWGFFGVINHGCSSNTVEKLDSMARHHFFALPSEIKTRAATSLSLNGYSAPSLKSPFSESLTFTRVLVSDSIQEVTDNIWPHGNSEFREAAEEYSRNMSTLANRIMKLIILSLGRDIYAKYFDSVFGKWEGYLRMNRYKAPPNNYKNLSKAMILGSSHRDLSCLTILYQDDVGGLRIKTKQGKWCSVDPVPHSFIVNIGDSLNMWSNNRFRSVEHRVEYQGEWKERVSAAFFCHFPEDMNISAPPELVDGEHPQCYKSIIFKDLRQFKAQNGVSADPPIKLLS